MRQLEQVRHSHHFLFASLDECLSRVSSASITSRNSVQTLEDMLMGDGRKRKELTALVAMMDVSDVDEKVQALIRVGTKQGKVNQVESVMIDDVYADLCRGYCYGIGVGVGRMN